MVKVLFPFPLLVRMWNNGVLALHPSAKKRKGHIAVSKRTKERKDFGRETKKNFSKSHFRHFEMFFFFSTMQSQIRGILSICCENFSKIPEGTHVIDVDI